LDGLGEFVEDLDSRLPIDASVSDALAVEEGRGVLSEGLFALDEVGFNHEAHDGLVAVSDELGEVMGDLGLVVVVFARVAVGTIDHHSRGLSGFQQ
jgi:hypothetical protein